MVIDFDMNSRGAAIQWLSQYTHEEELLFPPCTDLSCTDVSDDGSKRCIMVNAQVSTARLDTREVMNPELLRSTCQAPKRPSMRSLSYLIARRQSWRHAGSLTSGCGVEVAASAGTCALSRCTRTPSACCWGGDTSRCRSYAR